ncbi:hypothetical protein XM38_049410 [Halomicronema hongdechloris C2206]|uniref:Transposase IS204/IS1001/IS1096/IS1165 zinc-finger domain-containing protein n=1 Tax=Halomicronema hongdechloris C2206 TaxID=1641165 RepID=A0A1Z3HV09_9CYAN|nr:transposase family protein [Halomicronema hongdechloris]ASC73967.1 hypothetical protein XM38_049410 [Halomicronema hongdechloris C2206]
MQPLLTKLLNLPGVEVEDYYDLGDQLILDVEAQTDRATCPRCHQDSHHVHQNHPYLVRDLSISDRTVLLRVNRRQFKGSISFLREPSICAEMKG